MRTIGDMAKSVGLSRSTLLYYDRLGLLCPSGHIKGSYRLYSDRDAERLKKICSYRKAGISLDSIAKLLDSENRNAMKSILENRLIELNQELEKVREQQSLVASLLGRKDLINSVQNLNKDAWVQLLRDAGFSEDDMWNWHQRFEQSSPEKHHRFLSSLRIPEAEIAVIRKRSKSGK